MQITILSGAQVLRKIPISAEKTEFVLGRRHGDWAPDANLGDDPQISRKHCRLSFSNGKWIIENLSKYGTLVEGKKIQAPEELRPCNLVRSGNTTWTFVPDDWLFMHYGDLLISGAYSRTISYALCHSGVHVVKEIIVRNMGDRRFQGCQFLISIPGYSDVIQANIPSLDPGSKITIETPPIGLNFHSLRGQTEQVKAQLCFEIEGAEETRVSRDVWILGLWDLSFEDEARKSIAAFVLPQDEVVQQIVVDAGLRLKEATGSDSFRDVLKYGRDEAERLVLQSLYRCLRDDYDIKYIDPRARQGQDDMVIHQSVLPPRRLISNLRDRRGEGTCLDLALLFTGCVEHVGLSPLIIFSGNRNEAPYHAFSGCWIGSLPGTRPILTDVSLLLREVQRENLLSLDCTGFSKKNGKKMKWEEAVKCARDQMTEKNFSFAVDIGNLRQEPNFVLPVRGNFDPVVSRAYSESKRFAQSRNSETLELTHLLYGLLKAGGKITTRLFGETGVDLIEAKMLLERHMRKYDVPTSPTATANYLQCQRLAEIYGWTYGASFVREQDLIWAMLVTCHTSKALPKVLKMINTSCDQLTQAISQKHSLPVCEFESSSFMSGPAE